MALAYEGDNYRSKRSYITTGAFNGSIFQYTSQLNSTNLRTEGKLTAITTGPTGVTLTATNCPAGRILREVGAKLYPGVHPGLAVGDTFSGAVVGTTATNKYWVKVFDAQTGVRGFIDPNSSLITVYNSDKALEIQDALENAGGTPTRLGQPVNTAGAVIAGGQIRSSTVTSATQTYTTGAAANVITIDPTLGQVQVQTFEITGGTNTFTLATAAAPAAGSIVYLILKTSASHTTAASLAAGTNVKMNTVVLGTVASKTFGLTLVSDGTNLVQVGGDVVAVAM